MNHFKKIESFFKGDKIIWYITFFLLGCSLLFNYSGISLEQSIYKQLIFVVVSIFLMIFISNIPYTFFLNRILIYLEIITIIFLLGYLFWQARIVGGINSNRFIHFQDIGIQPSLVAMLTLTRYTVVFLSRSLVDATKRNHIFFWLPIVVILILIFVADNSTAMLIFLSVCSLLIAGGYPIKNLMIIIFGIVFLVAIFIVLVDKKIISIDIIPNRINTLLTRLSNFWEGKDVYQVVSAKMAIYEGGWLGNGFGNSFQKYVLPVRTSDFIFALIISETGLLGMSVILFAYFWLFQRFFIAIKKSANIKSQLFIIAMGFPIILYAFTNILVAVDFCPVTGQNLPLVSSGGTSLFCTVFSIATILNAIARKKL